MLVAVSILMLWATLRLAAGTPIGRTLNHWCVEGPARIANRVARAHVATALAVLIVVLLTLAAGEDHSLRMLAVMAPEVAIWITGLEIGLVVEAVVAVSAMLAAVSRAGIGAVFAGRLGGTRAGRRAKRARRVHRPSTAANDDDGDARQLRAA